MEATVAKIKKSGSAEIWVSLKEYQGRQYIDVREHFIADDRQWHPTKKGVMLLPELLPKVIDGVEALEDVSDLGTVAAVRKSARDEVQIGLREYAKTRYGEIRVWYAEDDNGEKKPSPRGVTFRLDLVERLGDALRDAHAHLRPPSGSR